METLARVRRGGKQKVVVEHVNVDSGGKAAVGTFVQQQPGGGGDEFEIEGQAHAIPSPSSQGRCGARTRNADRPCRSWRVTGKSRCRMHGGARGSGAPKGSRNGSYKHGGF